MDQYVVDFKTGFLFWELVGLRDLIAKSGNDTLKDYLETIENHIKEA